MLISLERAVAVLIVETFENQDIEPCCVHGEVEEYLDNSERVAQLSLLMLRVSVHTSVYCTALPPVYMAGRLYSTVQHTSTAALCWSVYCGLSTDPYSGLWTLLSSKNFVIFR